MISTKNSRRSFGPGDTLVVISKLDSEFIRCISENLIHNIKRLSFEMSEPVEAVIFEQLALLCGGTCETLELNSMHISPDVKFQLILRLYPKLTKIKANFRKFGNWLDDLLEADVSGLKHLSIELYAEYDENDNLINLNSNKLYKLCMGALPEFKLQLTFCTQYVKYGEQHVPANIWKLLNPHFRKVQNESDSTKIIIKDERFESFYGIVYNACFMEKDSNICVRQLSTICEERMFLRRNKKNLLLLTRGAEEIFYEGPVDVKCLRIETCITNTEFCQFIQTNHFRVLEEVIVSYPVPKGVTFDAGMLEQFAFFCSPHCLLLDLAGLYGIVYCDVNFQHIFALLRNLKTLRIDVTCMENWLDHLLAAEVTELERLSISLRATYDDNDALTNLNSQCIYEFFQQRCPSFRLHFSFSKDRDIFNKPADIWALLTPYFREVQDENDCVKLTISDRFSGDGYAACFAAIGETILPKFGLVFEECCFLLRNIEGELQFTRMHDRIFCDYDKSVVIRHLNVCTYILEAEFVNLINMLHIRSFQMIQIDSELTVDALMLNLLALPGSQEKDERSSDCEVLEFRTCDIERDVNFQLIFELFPKLSKLTIDVRNMENWLDDLFKVDVTRLELLEIHLSPSYDDSGTLIDPNPKSLYQFCKKLPLRFNLHLLWMNSIDISKFLQPYFCEAKPRVYRLLEPDPPPEYTTIHITDILSNRKYCLSLNVEVESKPLSLERSAIRKRQNKKYDVAVNFFKRSLFSWEWLLGTPKISSNRVDIKRFFNNDSVNFAVVVLRDIPLKSPEWDQFEQRALSIVTEAVEKTLEAVDGSGMFTPEDLELVISFLMGYRVSTFHTDQIRNRINEWKKKRLQAVKANINNIFDQINNLSDNAEDILRVYKMTTAARLSWLKKNKITVVNALKQLPHYKHHSNRIVDIDFNYLTLSKPPAITNIGHFFNVHHQKLIGLAIENKLITHTESEAFTTDVVALLTLPKLIEHYGKRSKNVKRCNIFYPKLELHDIECAKIAVRQMIDYPFITCAVINDTLTFAVVIEDTSILVSSAFDALDVFFKIHYSFRIEPTSEYKFFYDFIKQFMFNQRKPMHNNFLKSLGIVSNFNSFLSYIPFFVFPAYPDQYKASIPPPLRHEKPVFVKKLENRQIRMAIKVRETTQEYSYSSPTTSELTNLCNAIGIQFEENVHISTTKTVLQAMELIYAINVIGDGHCGYRALSVLLTGSQDYYMNIRQFICAKIADGMTLPNKYYEIMGDGMSLDERKENVIQKAKEKTDPGDAAMMKENWFDESDAAAIAYALDINTAIFDTRDYAGHWTVWNKELTPRNATLEGRLTLLLLLHKEHYNAIVGFPCKRKTLDGNSSQPLSVKRSQLSINNA